MKLTTTILPLAALSTAFVIPDEQAAQQLKLEKTLSFLDNVRENVKEIWSGAEEKLSGAVQFTENAFDAAVDSATKVGKNAAKSIEDYNDMARFETQQWLDSSNSLLESFDHPHHPPPHHGPPHHPPHHGDHKPNQTIYQLITGSKYTTKLAKLISDFPDVIKALNSTGVANYTIFAPTDNAFEKLPEHHKKPSKELIEKVLAYHISPEFYPAARVLVSHTIPTAFNSTELGGNPQRLRVGLSLKGLAVNFYSRVEAVNIFATNGVIHAVDSLLIPPPEILKIIDVLPGEFSTLQLGLIKTGLGEELEKAKHEHGSTFFAPSNFAFQKLGPRLNGFLFSEHGLKYLEALLKYHIVGGVTLYSDAYYSKDNKPKTKGQFHFDLPTLLEGKSLSVDIGSLGGFVSFKINGFTSVSVLDGIARDGVIQIVSSVLIPPKSPGDKAVELTSDMDIEELKELLIPSYAQEL